MKAIFFLSGTDNVLLDSFGMDQSIFIHSFGKAILTLRQSVASDQG